ncbi:hypothetical protein BH11PAT2_BH11PAT2_09560 [soil metagenome]
MARKIVMDLVLLAFLLAAIGLVIGLVMMAASTVPDLIHVRVSFETGLSLAKNGVFSMVAVTFLFPALWFMFHLPRPSASLTMQPAE